MNRNDTNSQPAGHDILELLNKHGLTSRQSMNLLERLARIIEMGVLPLP
jgi:hypothetical protein